MATVTAVLFGLAGGVSARAESFTVGEARIDLPVPEGLCALSRSEPRDQAVFALFDRLNQGTNQVLMIFADCAKLQSFRAGESQDSGYVGYWLAQLNPVTQEPYRIDGITPREFIEAAAQALSDGSVGVDDLTGDVSQRLDQIAQKLGTTASLSGTSMQLLSQDDRTLYLALSLDVAVGEGAKQRNASVMAMSLIKSYPISVNIYRPLTAPEEDFRLLAAAAEKSMTAALALNDGDIVSDVMDHPVTSAAPALPEVPSVVADDTGIDWILVGALGALAVISGLIVFAFVRRRR